MTSIWQTALIMGLAGTTLALVWAALLLSRMVSSVRDASELLSRRIDALSLRVRHLETVRERGDSTRDDCRPRRKLRADAGLSATSSGPTLITVPSLASSGSEAKAAAAANELSRRFGAIWDLADRGQSIAEIARETGHPVGQVELILGLRRSSSGPALASGGVHGHD